MIAKNDQIGTAKRNSESGAEERISGIPKNPAVSWAEAYLTKYATAAGILEMNAYEREYFAASGEDDGFMDELSLRAEMYEIRARILSLPDRDEKLILYYHYVHMEPLAKCAELLHVSRATAYRLHRRALLAFADTFLGGDRVSS